MTSKLAIECYPGCDYFWINELVVKSMDEYTFDNQAG